MSPSKPFPSAYATVAGADVTVAGQPVTATSGPSGGFALDLPASDIGSSVEIVADAPGFGEWSMRSVPVRAGDEVDLTVMLGSATVRQTMATPRSVAPAAPVPEDASTTATGCSGYSSESTPPSTISVYMTEEGTIQSYDFEYYVEHVLPSEWIPSWGTASLEAGAMAVKDYGWYWVNNWRGGSLNGTCFDVDDTSDYQVFQPSVSYTSTDQAVEQTWSDLALEDGDVFEASYSAGPADAACARVDGVQMYQWGTEACADQGDDWQQILQTYYDGVQVSS
jgi:peptidoglycan hydrolase-like amidase